MNDELDFMGTKPSAKPYTAARTNPAIVDGQLCRDAIRFIPTDAPDRRKLHRVRLQLRLIINDTLPR